VSTRAVLILLLRCFSLTERTDQDSGILPFGSEDQCTSLSRYDQARIERLVDWLDWDPLFRAEVSRLPGYEDSFHYFP